MQKKEITLGATGCLGVLFALALGYAFFGFLVMVAWNVVVPTLFHGPVIDYPVGLGIAFFLGVLGSLLSR